MEVEHTDTVACPSCSGTIKAAARICKHCKRPVDGTENSGAGTGSVPSVAPVVGELRAFVVARGVVRPEQFDALVAAHPTVDAAVTLEHLAAEGFVTAVQIESLRDGFSRQQEERAAAMLRAAQDRGLLMPTHVEEALAKYRDVLFQQTIVEYVTSAGLLTVTQATEFKRSMSLGGNVVARGRAWWGRLSKTSRRILLGMVGVLLLIYGISHVVDASRGGARITESAIMNGLGSGTATFTNRGTHEGSMCGHVYVTCGRGSRSSATFCSGTVGPNETKRVEFTVPGMDRIGTYGRDWRDDCDFEFFRESTGE